VDTTVELTRVLVDHGFKVYVTGTVFDKLCQRIPGREEGITPFKVGRDRVDLIIVLGGDGSMLQTARMLNPDPTPLLGVNLGNVGFLTELEIDDLPAAVKQLRAGEFRLEERMMLSVAVVRGDARVFSGVALNDVVITRGTMARIIRLRTFINKENVLDTSADGLIVASPTGSTAYSLSAGGPIVHPGLNCLIITPICPHTLSSRSVITPSDEQLTVEVEADHAEIMLTVDGQVSYPLRPGDRIAIGRAVHGCTLVRLKERLGFHEVLHSRLKQLQV